MDYNKATETLRTTGDASPEQTHEPVSTLPSINRRSKLEPLKLIDLDSMSQTQLKSISIYTHKMTSAKIHEVRPRIGRNRRKRLLKSVDSATELGSPENPETTGVASDTQVNSASPETSEQRWKVNAGCTVNQIRQSRRKIEMDVQRLHSRVQLLLQEE